MINLGIKNGDFSLIIYKSLVEKPFLCSFCMLWNDECNVYVFCLTLFCSLLKVAAFAEQSYNYYSGYDGTEKDSQVVKSAFTKA